MPSVEEPPQPAPVPKTWAATPAIQKFKDLKGCQLAIAGAATRNESKNKMRKRGQRLDILLFTAHALTDAQETKIPLA